MALNTFFFAAFRDWGDPSSIYKIISIYTFTSIFIICLGVGATKYKAMLLEVLLSLIASERKVQALNPALTRLTAGDRGCDNSVFYQEAQ